MQTVVLTGKKETFVTHRLTLPPIDNLQVKRHHDQLMDLGFQFLGDLSFLSRDGITAYSYSQPEQSIYALIYVTHSIEKIPCDLFSSFTSGASLTTSTTPSSHGDIPKVKIYKSSYPEAKVDELYILHQMRLEGVYKENLKVDQGDGQV